MGHYTIKIEFDIINSDDNMPNENTIEALGILAKVSAEIARFGIQPTKPNSTEQTIESINWSGEPVGSWGITWHRYSNDNLKNKTIPELINILSQINKDSALLKYVDGNLSINVYKANLIQEIIATN